jgi:peptidoglycan/LPS O-acetylase OafA/YrhL
MNIPFTWMETFREAGIISRNETYYNLAWWSLQIEVAFYMVVPLVILVFPKAEKITARWVWMSIVLTFASTLFLQFFLTAYFPNIYNAKVLIQTIWRFIDYPVCFLMGVLLAVRDFDRKTAWAFIISGAALILGSLYYFQLMQTGYGLLYGGILILGFNSQKLRKVLSSPGMIWLGERSYSLFLVHFSVFYLINNLVSRITPDRNAAYAILTRGVGIPVALFVAMLLFHFVERRQARGLLTANMFWPWQAKGLTAKKPEKVLEHA